MTSIELVRDLEPAPYIKAMTHLTSFAECDEVIRSTDFVQGSHRESSPFVGDSLIVLDGEAHFDRRRLEAALFTRAALDHYENSMLTPHIRKVIESTAERQRGPDGIVRADLTKMLRAMLARITATITGVDGVDDIDSTERFISYIEQLNKGVTIEWQTEDHDALMARLLALREEFVAEFFEPSTSTRAELVARVERGEAAESELPRDLLTLLFLNWDDRWDAEFALRESTLFYAAATQTTTHAAPHVISHLTAWMEDHPDRRHLLADGPFLKRASYESMRLHVPVHALLRIATRDVVLGGGRRIARGERVACCFAPANRDRAAFGDDAAEFDPFRDTGNLKPWGLSFGGGPHMCIGRTLVTGLSARTDGTEGTEGTVARILSELYAAGVEIDPDDRPEYVATAHVDAYERFPVRFNNL